MFFNLCWIWSKKSSVSSFYKQNNFNPRLTKQLLNMFKLWCELGISRWRLIAYIYLRYLQYWLFTSLTIRKVLLHLFLALVTLNLYRSRLLCAFVDSCNFTTTTEVEKHTRQKLSDYLPFLPLICDSEAILSKNVSSRSPGLECWYSFHPGYRNLGR